MPDYLRHLFDPAGFPARWHCGDWSPAMGWASQAADAVIAVAYFAIPAALLALWRHRRREFNAEGSSILLWFASFIGLCGVTHLADIAAFYWPAYRLFVAVDVLTGLVSVSAALLLPKVVRAAATMPSREELRQSNRLLSGAYDELAGLNVALRDRLDELRARRDDADGDATETLDHDIAELRRLLDGIEHQP